MSFRAKILSGIALIQAVVLTLLVWNGLTILRESYQTELVKRARSTMELIASSAQGSVLTSDLGSLQNIVDQVVRQPDVDYIRILGNTKVLAEAGSARNLSKPFVADQTPEGNDDVFDNEQDIIIANKKYGRIEIGFSQNEFKKEFASAMTESIGFSLLALVLAALFSIMLAHYLTRGLQQLVLATRQIAQGKFDYQVNVQGRDELAQAAHAFNDMSEQLRSADNDRKRAEQDLMTLNENLERRVQERTQQLDELNKVLERQALHDVLTTIPNRTLFHDRLMQAAILHRREGNPFMVLAVDLDRFKAVNDTLGHHTGDMVLKEIAMRLRTSLREMDTIARMGGDEFALILPGIGDEATASAVVQKIIDAVTRPIIIGNRLIDIGISIGIALCPQHGDNGDDLLRRADAAMYNAKRAGGGHSFFREELEAIAQEQSLHLTELRSAIEDQQLILHYQPKIDLLTNTINGVECLVRWQHPTQGLIFPDNFIPLAEKSGLIKSLTLSVLKIALTQCATWQNEGIGLSVAVNISTINIQDEDFPRIVASLLRETHAQPHWLEIEITETAIMTNPILAIENIKNLSEMGVQVSIDDFGTGYSSMTYLKKLLIAKIKIDKSFVMDMEQNANDAVIVRSAIDLGHNLGLKVVAEGVEDLDTWKALQKLGCDSAQGYYMSRPLPPQQFLEWLKNSAWGKPVMKNG